MSSLCSLQILEYTREALTCVRQCDCTEIGCLATGHAKTHIRTPNLRVAPEPSIAAQRSGACHRRLEE